MYNCKMSSDENTKLLHHALKKNAIYHNAKSRVDWASPPQFSSPTKVQ